MMRPLLLAAAATALLSACGEEEAAIPPTPEEQEDQDPAGQPSEPERPAPDAQVAVSDVLGTFEGETYGMAVWAHPTLSFEGAVLVANGEAGLAVVPVDNDVEMSTVEGTFDGPVAVAYPDDGDPSNTLVAAAGADGLTLYTIDPQSRAFSAVGEVRTDEPTRALCARGSRILRVDGGGGVSVHTVSLDGSDASVSSEESPLAFAATCAAAPAGFYVLSEEGLVATLDDEGGLDATYEETFGEQTVTNLVALGTGPASAELIAADGEARLHLASSPPSRTGGLPPTVTIAADGEPDSGGVAFLAAGSGNFGSIYRDGVIAVLDERQELKLIPWAGLSRAFGLGASQTVGARTLNVETVSGPAAPQIELPQSVGAPRGE